MMLYYRNHNYPRFECRLDNPRLVSNFARGCFFELAEGETPLALGPQYAPPLAPEQCKHKTRQQRLE